MKLLVNKYKLSTQFPNIVDKCGDIQLNNCLKKIYYQYMPEYGIFIENRKNYA